MWSLPSLECVANALKFSDNLLKIDSGINTYQLSLAFSLLSVVPNLNLRHLQLTKCTVAGSDFLEFLRQTSTMTELNLSGVKILKHRGRVCNPIELKLTDLGLEHGGTSTDWIFEHLHVIEVSNHLKFSVFRPLGRATHLSRSSLVCVATSTICKLSRSISITWLIRCVQNLLSFGNACILNRSDLRICVSPKMMLR